MNFDGTCINVHILGKDLKYIMPSTLISYRNMSKSFVTLDEKVIVISFVINIVDKKIKTTEDLKRKKEIVANFIQIFEKGNKKGKMQFLRLIILQSKNMSFEHKRGLP